MKYTITLFIFFSLVACSNSKKTPDVSKIKVELTTQRFEQDFFALDSNHLDAGMQQLYVNYQQFYVDFLQNILASDPQPDSVLKNVQLFTNAYKNIYTVSQSLYADVTPIEKEIKQGLKLMKYYFPDYQLPTQLVTYVGPWDAMFMLSTKNGGSGVFRDGPILGIGLQLFLGSDFSIYKEQAIQEMYPNFISRRFDKKYITTDAMKVLLDDIYPDKSVGKPLIQQMIEAGKRLYILQALVPDVADSITTGYTQQQLDGCFKNEANIWSFFVVNNLLFVNDFNLIKDYLNDAPNTQALGDESPGFIGQFVGWQIVKKWIKKNSSVTLQELLNKRLSNPAPEISERNC